MKMIGSMKLAATAVFALVAWTMTSAAMLPDSIA